MNIKEHMSPHPVSVSPEDTIAVAARLLRRYNIGMLPVCDADRRLRGVITDRDIVLRCIALDIDPQKTEVGDVMSDHVIAVSPETDPLKAMSLMGQEQIRRLPVCEQGRLVGMISLGDLARTYSLEASEALTHISLDTQNR